MDALKIIERRKALGLSQRGLAKKTGLNRGTIVSAEMGRPLRPTTVKVIASALGLSDEPGQRAKREILEIAGRLERAAAELKAGIAAL